MPECKLLQNHMCATVSGNWRPCCKFDESVLPWEKRFLVDKSTFKEWRNSEFYQGIIEQQNSGWHKGCYGCKKAEETGNRSMRKIFGEYLSGEENSIEFVEISLSRECNLACRMCGPYASSTWQKIVVDNQQDFQEFLKPQNQTPIDFKKMFDDVDVRRINRIKLLGGEPFITPQTTDFFEYLDDNNILPNIIFMTNTNVTFFPKKLVKHLNKIPKMNVSMSIDGFAKNNDYVRYKSNWNNVLSVIDEWKEFKRNSSNEIILTTTTCVNAYNVHQIDEIVKWAIDQKFVYNYNIINGPKHLTLEALPPKYVSEIIIPKLSKTPEVQSVITYIEKMNFNDVLLDKFKRFTFLMDRITGNKIQDYNPILYKYLEL